MFGNSSEKECTLQAGLYLVATPIGNLGDISLRALEVLKAVDQIYCEDTRVSKKLLTYYGISKKLRVYNDHSDDVQRVEILRQMQAGERVALISDAGMPLISDPGYKLVSDAQKTGLGVHSVPGANAPLAALQLSGLPSDQFCFLGFLPQKQAARRQVLEQWRDVPGTLVMFETAPRLLAALTDIEAVMGARDMAVVREITKKFEEVQRGTPQALLEHFEGKNGTKGEIVLVIGAGMSHDYTQEEIDAYLRDALEQHSTKDAAAAVSRRCGVSKKSLYARAIQISGDGC